LIRAFGGIDPVIDDAVTNDENSRGQPVIASGYGGILAQMAFQLARDFIREFLRIDADVDRRIAVADMGFVHELILQW
jgi:hypothetical protein